MRYELKMVFPETEYAAVINNLYHSRRFIREIYHERQINNIYFDTLNYSDYFANMHGDGNRLKYRIRWYDTLSGEIDSPTLELKYKKGLAGGKKTLMLPRFRYGGTFDFLSYAKELSGLMCTSGEQDCALLGGLLQRSPALVNSYKRRYFLTRDNKYRITLDKQLWYAAPAVASFRPDVFGSYDHTLVLEVKFDADDHPGAASLINELGYRLSRNSKYVNGIQSTLGDL